LAGRNPKAKVPEKEVFPAIGKEHSIPVKLTYKAQNIHLINIKHIET